MQYSATLRSEIGNSASQHGAFLEEAVTAFLEEAGRANCVSIDLIWLTRAPRRHWQQRGPLRTAIAVHAVRSAHVAARVGNYYQ